MGRLSVVLRKMRSAKAMSWQEIALILPVFLLLGLARMAILTLPFRIYAPYFGRQIGLETPSPRPISARDQARVNRIGRVVRRTADATPWQSKCLAQASVASFLLRLVDIPYFAAFGLRVDDTDNTPDPLAAHCWVRVGDRNVTGGQDISDYTVVMVFDRQTRHSRQVVR